MENKEEINVKVYQPIKELKQKMYECKTQDNWDEYKGQLLELFKVAESMMNKSFYDKYRQGIVDSITKIYGYKEKQFNKKQFVPQPKQNYIFREGAESEAFVKLCNTISQFLEIKMSLSELG